MPFNQIQLDDIKFNPDVQSLCVSKSFTCPNYNHTWSCPPVAPYLEEEVKIYKDFYLIYSTFNLASHIEEMKLKHPKWSELRIKLQYQMKSVMRDDLVKEVTIFLDQYKKLYEKRLILYDGFCRVCHIKEDGGCTYDSGKHCRYPDQKRYSMEAVCIEVIRTVIESMLDIGFPSQKYDFRFGLACFK
jgi:predicted metal-binding protein